MLSDTIKELMSYPKYRSVKVINNPTRLIVGDDFRVNWDCLRLSIPTSAVGGVSLIISESSTTLLSVTITESIGTVRAY